MPRTLKFSLGISFALIGLVAVFLGLGFAQDTKYKNSVEEVFNATPEQIWTYLIDVESIPNRRKEVVSVEIIEKDPQGLVSVWKEIPDMGGYMKFRRGEFVPNVKLEVILFESSYKMLGKWTYELTNKNGNTLVRVTEETEIVSPLLRGAFFLAGRDSTLQQELDFLRNFVRERIKN